MRGSPGLRPAAFKISAVVTVSIGRSMIGRSGLFLRIVATAKGFDSTATAILKPAFSRPKSKPSAPENSEMTAGFCRLRFRSGIPLQPQFHRAAVHGLEQTVE